MTTPIEFWFDFASPYSYPAAMAIEARAVGREVRWRPVTMGPIFADLGWTDSPFNLQPAKGRYMWRDMERICAAEGLAFHRTDPFPPNTVLAARLAIVALERTWGPDFCRAVFHAEFAGQKDVADPDVLAGLITDCGGDADTVAAAALSTANKPRLRVAVEEARRKGIFGAPTFVIEGEVFWGFDRLEAALAWPV